MKKILAVAVCYGLIVSPLHAGTSPAVAGAGAASLLEAAEIAAASGVYRAQNTSTITTGRIRPGDKKRSALAFAISGGGGVRGRRALALAALPERKHDVQPERHGEHEVRQVL